MSRPAISPLLRRYVKAAVTLALLVFLAAACSSDGFPESYGDQVNEETGMSNVEQNWLEGCEVGLAQSDLAEDANNVCACSYNAISGDGGIAFADFVSLDSDLKGDPSSLATPGKTLTPTENQLLEIVRSCIAGG